MSANPSPFPGGAGTLPAVWLPADNGLLTASGPPFDFSSAATLVAGTLYLAKLPVRQSQTITNLLFALSAAGVGASSGSFAGLYSSAGVLLSGSADIAALITGSTGPITVPLTSPQAVTAGFCWGAILVNLATTQPQLEKTGVSAVSQNMGVTNPALFQFATNGTGQTVLPASITPGSNASATQALLIGAT
jgi:hypothetical protein